MVGVMISKGNQQESVKSEFRYMTNKQRLNLARLLALIFVIAISIYGFYIRDQAAELAKYGYPGIFILSIFANGTIFLPAPGVLFVFAMGAIFNPVGVAFASGLGAAIGELTGYLAGFSGQAIVEGSERYEMILKWMKTHPRLNDLAIFFLALIPNPLFDLAGIAAGTLKMPVIRFLIVVAAGKILKMLIFAYAGASSINWFLGE